MIGRSPSADVVIADTSVAPHHAELVVTADGRFHLTDCATESGTWRHGADGAGAMGWQAVRQAFVRADEPLRLGDHRCTANDLLRWSRAAPAEASSSSGGWEAAPQRRVRGPVARDPVTGEIVRRRP